MKKRASWTSATPLVYPHTSLPIGTMLICPSPPAERPFSRSCWLRLVRVSQSPPTSLRTTETIGTLDWNLCQAGPGPSCCSKDCIVMPSQLRVRTRGDKKFPDLYVYPSMAPPVVKRCVFACGDAARTLTKRSGSTKTSLPSEHLSNVSSVSFAASPYPHAGLATRRRHSDKLIAERVPTPFKWRSSAPIRTRQNPAKRPPPDPPA